jgi:hypothetical protein
VVTAHTEIQKSAFTTRCVISWGFGRMERESHVPHALQASNNSSDEPHNQHTVGVPVDLKVRWELDRHHLPLWFREEQKIVPGQQIWLDQERHATSTNVQLASTGSHRSCTGSGTPPFRSGQKGNSPDRFSDRKGRDAHFLEHTTRQAPRVVTVPGVALCMLDDRGRGEMFHIDAKSDVSDPVHDPRNSELALSFPTYTLCPLFYRTFLQPLLSLTTRHESPGQGLRYHRGSG